MLWQTVFQVIGACAQLAPIGVGEPLQTHGAGGWILIIMRELSAPVAALTAFQCRQCPVVPTGHRGSSRALLMKISG